MMARSKREDYGIIGRKPINWKMLRDTLIGLVVTAAILTFVICSKGV